MTTSGVAENRLHNVTQNCKVSNYIIQIIFILLFWWFNIEPTSKSQEN